MRHGFFLLACALLVGAAACGGDAGGGAHGWKSVAEATGAARTERIARVLREHEGALGKFLDEGRRGDAEFAATEAATEAAADLIDAYRPGKPDPTLVLLGDRSQRWPRSVRAAALRAVARLHEPTAVRLLSGRAWTLDAAEEDTAAAWVGLAEALAPAGDVETRGKMRGALEGVAAQHALDGDTAGAARARTFAARLAAIDDPARAPGDTDVETLRGALILGTPDERAAAAAALARVGSEEARASIAKRADAEKDPFVAHQLRRLAARGGGDAGFAAAFAAWSARREAALEDTTEAGARALAGAEAEAKGLLARFGPKVRDLGPADRLAVARLAEAVRDGAGLRRALATLKDERDEEGRIATTWIASLALEDHDPAGALVFLRRLEKDFEGRGLDARGRAVSAEILAGAIVDEAAAVARRAVEGSVPDPAAAARALAVGREARASAREDEEAADLLEEARAWVELDAAGLAAAIPAAKGPRVVAFADHYQLLEPVLPSVLKRWARGMDVSIVGVLEGKVRHGIRRSDATPEEERAAIAAAAKEIGVPVVRFVGGAGSDAPRPAWLHDVPAALLIFDADGKLVARSSGSGLDPRSLEAAIAPLSRDPAATAPPR